MFGEHSFAEIKITLNDAELIHKAPLSTAMYLSELKIGATVFQEYLYGCYNSDSHLRINDQQIQLEWPERDYDDVTWAITRVSEHSVKLEIAVTNGRVDDSAILGLISILDEGSCEAY